MSIYGYRYTTVRLLLESELQLRDNPVNSGTISQTELLPLIVQRQRRKDVN